MKRRFSDGELELEVEHRPFGLDGRGGVRISIPASPGFQLTMSLEDAENLGEALIKCVRAAEGRW